MVRDKLCIKLKKSLIDFSFFVLGMKIYNLYATKSNQDPSNEKLEKKMK